MVKARGDHAAHGLHDGEVGAGVAVGAHEVGVEAPGHAGARGGLAVHGELGDHGHGRGELRAAAKGHEHGGGADRGVKALGEALVGGHVEIGHEGSASSRRACRRPRCARSPREPPRARRWTWARRWRRGTRGSRPRWSCRASSCAGGAPR